MTQANLSETLFKPRFKHPETSTLVRRFNHGAQPPVQSALDGKTIPHWYRMGLTSADMGSEWGFSVRTVKFICRVFIPVGEDMETVENYVGFRI